MGDRHPAASRPRYRGVDVGFGVAIPMRDGVELSATSYRPEGEPGPLPTLFTLTPYIAQSYHDRAMQFAETGFVFLTVDVRGRGNSGGDFAPFRNERSDGYDIVEWIAAQPFCDGQVAMWGGSYGGFAQWMAAVARPRHLTTIVPVASPFIGTDLPGRSNIPLPYMMQWLTLVWGRASQDRLFWNNAEYWGAKFADAHLSGRPFASLDEQFGFASPVFQEWLAHPEQGPYWEAYNPRPGDYAALTLPILTITGAYDGDQPGALRHYREHRASGSAAPHHLVIGPWDHAGTRVPVRDFCGLSMGPNSLVDLQQLHVDWYRWTMAGGPKPAFLKGEVAYYVAGADQWRYAPTLDAVTDRHEPLYLSSAGEPTDVFSSGSLDHEAGDSSPDCYCFDPMDGRLAGIERHVDPESRSDQRMILASAGRQLVYHGRAFAEPCEVAGFFRFEAWISIDQPDTDFRVAIHEVLADGRVILLTTDLLRARYREDPCREELVDSTEPRLYRFDRFTFIAREIAVGSRLRLVIGPNDSIYAQKNHNSGGVVALEDASSSRPVTVRLFHDKARPAILFVPLGRSDPA